MKLFTIKHLICGAYLIGALVFTGCGGENNFDKSTILQEIVDDISGNNNGIKVSAKQLNEYLGEDLAIVGVDYAKALQEGIYADRAHPTSDEIKSVVLTNDADKDGIPDVEEVKNGTDPLVPDNNQSEEDTTKPVITLKGANPVELTQGTAYTEAGATATDDRDGSVNVTISGSVDSSKVGTYTITYTAKDKAGNVATKTRTVKVVLPPDTTKPVITLKGANLVELTQGTAYTEAGATATDDRDGSVNVTISGSVDSSKVGTYTITYSAKDKAGNVATKTRTVKVVLPPDTIKPIITLLGEKTVSLTEGATYRDAGATATDDRDGSVNVTISGSVDSSKVGTYTITYTAKDKAGNVATKTRTVKVVSAPVVLIDYNTSNDIKLAKQEPYYKYTWHIDSKESALNDEGYEVDDNADINLTEAWKFTMGQNVKVAVIDDGGEVNHEELKDRIFKAYDADMDDSNVSTEKEEGSHGNTCAGFIVADINGKGTVGVAPKSKLILIQQDYPSEDNVIYAFEYARKQGAKVISCSCGTEDVSDIIVSELKSLYDDNITILFASGNDGKSLDTEGINDESEVEWVIGVGASTEKNDVGSYSNYGKNIDVIAPGGDTDISSGLLGIDDMGEKGSEEQLDLVNNNYKFTDGTSFATPISAGVVALMYSVNPTITPKEVREILIKTATKVGEWYNDNSFDERRAYGKINAGLAVKMARESYGK